jgi:cyclic peptide transporter
MMEFLRFLKRESKDFNTNFFLVGSFAGIVNAALLVILTMAAGEAAKEGPSLKTFLITAVFLAGFWWSKRYMLHRARIIVEEIIRNIRVRIGRKILEANLASFERVGGASFFNVVSRHASTISQAAIVLIQNSHSIVLVVLAFLFIMVISMKAFLLVAGTLGLLIALFLNNYGKVMGMMREVAGQENAFVTGFNDLTQGFKELKMNSAKDWQFFHEHYRKLADRSMELRKAAGLELNKNLLVAHVAFFILLAAVVFVLPKLGEKESESVVMVVTIVIYIFGPISELVGAVPFIMEAAGSIHEITRVETLLTNMTKDSQVVELEASPTGRSSLGDFSSIRCHNLEFHYPDTDSDRTFKLGPINFELNAGEVVFIVGGNGSGKSSFFKVLCGLYAPDSGTISVDGRAITDETREDYRNLITPIFSDFHLFDQLFGMEIPSAERAADLLHLMEITGKTKFKGRTITETKLSAGQRKRVALLTAIQEDRPVMCFDEWAAEQDPLFRRKFYQEIIPNLKARGKTLVIITHDDRYFKVADRILKMEYGKFVEHNGEGF